MRFFSNVFILAVLATALLAGTLPSLAAAPVKMKVRPGLGGLYKVNQHLELVITVDNPGPGFAGTITVEQDEERPERRRPDLARVATDVDVPAGASGQYRLVIPGELASVKPVVRLVSGGQVLAESWVEGVAVDDGRMVILALGEDVTGGGLQDWLSQGVGSLATLKYLSPGELPGDSLLLSAADIIMIGPAGVSRLSQEQVKALKEWVYLGGSLVLLGGAGAGEGGSFTDVSPVQVSSRQVVAGKLEGLRSGGPLLVAAGRLVAGKALAVENGVPVLARRPLGRGEVLYCGAAPGDLGGEARDVWSALLNSTIPGPGIKVLLPQGPYPTGNPAVASLVAASAYIPRLAGPPVPVLALLWLVYATAVGPLLYFLLRRADRRDWAWALVPAGALVAAGCFYLLAPAGRIQGYLTQTLAAVEILSPEMAEVRAGASVVTTRGGDLTVQAAPGMLAGPSSGSTNRTAVLVQQNKDTTTVNFGNVQYNSLRQVYALRLRRDLGSIAGRLYLEGNSIKGDLVNKTGLDLRDCKLILGSRVIPAGNLPAGGTVHIEEKLEGVNPPADPEMLLAALGVGKPGRPGDPYFRERMMLNEIIYGDYGRPAGIQFIGWYDGSPGIFAVAGKSGRSADYGLVLVKQTIPLDAAGRFYLPAGLIKPRIGEFLMPGRSPSPENIAIDDQKVHLVYDLDDAGISRNFQIAALDIQYAKGQFNLSVEIYNHQEGRWEQLPDGGKRIGSADLSRYLSHNQVWLKVTGESRGPYPAWPGLAVEGEVS
ncbi:Class I glutamine amidotransferase-like [Moorella glycerini]|uniref:DUF4350 domain-containing protein n=1 Tax=Neomoorella stamsii TaxID=1266720 RepID=A0A9X7IZW4_9FIRM|nr:MULTISPECIES: hypothetical protein [Moorella]PRR68983.1 hypothetical protein MOST_32650 [Moorella stamsii]CEP67604.1 Class I glutamine amidotransferase-like [Moorella glycerini]